MRVLPRPHVMVLVWLIWGAVIKLRENHRGGCMMFKGMASYKVERWIRNIARDVEGLKMWNYSQTITSVVINAVKSKEQHSENTKRTTPKK